MFPISNQFSCFCLKNTLAPSYTLRASGSARKPELLSNLELINVAGYINDDNHIAGNYFQASRS